MATVFCLVAMAGVVTAYVHSKIAQYRDAAPCGTPSGILAVLEAAHFVVAGNCKTTPKKTCANPGEACTIPGYTGKGTCQNGTLDANNPCMCVVRPPTTPPSDNSKNSPLKIIFKPNAKYTGEAKAKHVQGTVTVSVEFLANGTIGDISVIRGLPYGLTTQAIAAAGQIKFAPAIVNGNPTTVTQAIEYSFTLPLGKPRQP